MNATTSVAPSSSYEVVEALTNVCATWSNNQNGTQNITCHPMTTNRDTHTNLLTGDTLARKLHNTEFIRHQPTMPNLPAPSMVTPPRTPIASSRREAISMSHVLHSAPSGPPFPMVWPYDAVGGRWRGGVMSILPTGSCTPPTPAGASRPLAPLQLRAGRAR